MRNGGHVTPYVVSKASDRHEHYFGLERHDVVG